MNNTCGNCGEVTTCDKSMLKHCVGLEGNRSPQVVRAEESNLSVLLSGINSLIDTWDKMEDNNHNSANTEGISLHVKDTFRCTGTTYGICAEELRILIKAT